jgi:hypothetical protein
VHFYSTFWSLTRSDRGTVKFFQADATSRRAASAGAAPVRAVPRLGVWAHPRTEAALPQATRPPRPPRSLAPFLARRAVRPANARRTAGRSSAPPARHSYRGRHVLLGVRRRSLGHWHARGHLLNEADALPRSRSSYSPPGTPVAVDRPLKRSRTAK